MERKDSGETVRGGKLYDSKSGACLKCIKNHTKNDTCLECGAKGCILERGYDPEKPETIPGPDNCGVCGDCAQKYVFGNKSMCAERGCEGLIAEREHNGSRRVTRDGYCSFHQHAKSQAERAEVPTEGISIARNKRRGRPAAAAPAPTTGQAALPAPTTGQAELNQMGIMATMPERLHFVELPSRLRQTTALGTAAGTKTAGKIMIMQRSASVAGVIAGALCTT